MSNQQRTKVEWILWLIAAICMLINLYYLIIIDVLPKWVRFTNVIGWILILVLSFKQYRKKA
jgi:hypothetical protein